ncbi:MAG: hypothetical protein QNJ29_13295 [Rhizobiaceae bacterium]|nr:hypothetical protein [Rhizobiaceae bacterium]
MKIFKKAILGLGFLGLLSGTALSQGLSNGSEANSSEVVTQSQIASPQMTGRVEWRGGGVFAFLSPACFDVGWDLDAPVKVRFRPSGLGTNGETSGIAFHFHTFSTGLRINGSITNGFKPYSGFGVSGTGYNSTGFIRFNQILPAAYNETTNLMQMAVYVTRFGGDVGCNAIIRATLQRRDQ